MFILVTIVAVAEPLSTGAASRVAAGGVLRGWVGKQRGRGAEGGGELSESKTEGVLLA
jgi:hypothetical protein